MFWLILSVFQGMVTTKFTSEHLLFLFLFLIKFLKALTACYMSILGYSADTSNSLRGRNEYYLTLEGPCLLNSAFTNIPWPLHSPGHSVPCFSNTHTCKCSVLAAWPQYSQPSLCLVDVSFPVLHNILSNKNDVFSPLHFLKKGQNFKTVAKWMFFCH